ncbi:MAG: hypothetical protein ABR979_07410 [Halobacteriota archaeon]
MSEAQTVVLRREEFDAVVFDMDGVVTKTATVHAAAWKRLFDDYMGERLRSIFDRVPYVALLPRPYNSVPNSHSVLLCNITAKKKCKILD